MVSKVVNIGIITKRTFDRKNPCFFNILINKEMKIKLIRLKMYQFSSLNLKLNLCLVPFAPLPIAIGTP